MNKSIKAIVMVFVLAALAVGSYLYFNKKEPEVPAAKDIEVYGITSGQSITSPLTIKGRVNGGHWAGFEGQVGTVELVGSGGERLGLAILTATSDWMTFPTDFETVLTFGAPTGSDVSLIFHNENPSGMPDREETLTIPVKFVGETSTVKVYFGKQDATGDVCTEVFAVDRKIIKTEAVAKAAIEELIKGPTSAEKDSGYFSGINQNTKINKLTITNGTAMIDFDESLEAGVGGSCRVTGIRQQIIKTLTQFPSVTKVIISIDGRTEDILQP